MSDSSFSDDELRDRIREVKRDEEQVSYERRMLHGRIDVVRSEILARIDRRTGVEQCTRRSAPGPGAASRPTR